MENVKKSTNQVSRRKFVGLTATAAAFSVLPGNFIISNSGNQKENKPNSKFGGVQVGAITYSWRSMPGSAEDILQYCLRTGISTIELMGDVAEKYAGLPQGPVKPDPGVMLSDAEIASFEKATQEAREAQRIWRISAPMKKFEDLRKMYNDAGVSIHIAKFSPENWTDKEIEYSFKAAKALGAKGVTNEIGDKAAQKLGPIAQKMGMYAIFHQHLQPGEPGWTLRQIPGIFPCKHAEF